MRIIFKRHRWETNCIIVTDPLIEEKALDPNLQAVQGYLRLRWSDHIELPILVQEVHAAVRLGNSSVDRRREGNRNSLLVRTFD